MIEALILKYGYDKFKKFCQVLAVGFGVVASLFVFVSHERSVGARNVVTTIDKSNNKAVAIGTGSARKSADDGVRGQIDPSTRYNGPAR